MNLESSSSQEVSSLITRNRKSRARRSSLNADLRLLCVAGDNFMLTKSMRTASRLLVFFVLLWSGASVCAAEGEPKPEVFGIRLNMSEDEARARLKQIGTQKEEENEREGEHEVWLLRDKQYAYLVVAFDREHKVRYIIASARKGVRVPYSELGDLKKARQATDGKAYSYTWTIKAQGEREGYGLIARGSDPKYLTSYTLYRIVKSSEK
jgi:hypothetical protein